jgi:hypothetical protein
VIDVNPDHQPQNLRPLTQERPRARAVRGAFAFNRSNKYYCTEGNDVDTLEASAAVPPVLDQIAAQLGVSIQTIGRDLANHLTTKQLNPHSPDDVMI